ncbi:hypothetical protein [Cellulomonas sp. NS3]|uniref:hypothetical protein n=1 Tax=Cellulomonas sp. NS3 TaxID=2973977 RepID=UPI00216303B9|nr:hypothetical protein [Cellulomonas sp. NS3]
MARLRVTATEVYVRMHWLERLSTFYWRAAPRVPRDAVTGVSIVKPTVDRVEGLVKVPFILNFGTLPGRLCTTLPKVRTWAGQPAFAATMRFVPALVVELDAERVPWALWVVSDRDALSLAQTLRTRAR